MACNKCDNKCYSCECTCSSNYETEGCLNYEPTDCTYYTEDVNCLGVKKRDSLTKMLRALVNYVLGMFGRVSSSTLDIKRTGACSDSMQIELIPSVNQGNALSLGTDGRPFVSKGDVNLVSTQCVSWQKTINGNTITFVPVFDWNCISQQVCPLCENQAPCAAPTGVMVMSTGQNTIQLSWNTIASVNYDIIVDGSVQHSNAVGPYTITGLSPNTTYSISVRAKCASGSTADTSMSVTTLGLASCVAPSSLTIVIS